MSATAEALLSEFDALPQKEKEVFARAIWKRLPAIDSGDLADDDLAFAGDQLASLLEEEEKYEAESR